MKAIRTTMFLLWALTLGYGCQWQPESQSAESQEEVNDMPGLTPLALEFTNGTTDAVDYGVTPGVYSDRTTQITVAVWGYISEGGYLVSFSSNAGGVRFSISDVAAEAPYLRVYSNVFNSAPGNWNTDVFDSVLGGWHHFAYTYNLSSASNNPIFYFDGAAVNATETLTPAGTAYSRDAVPLIIGNRFSATEYYDDAIGGKLFDARVYNVILTASEIALLYNGGTPSMLAASGKEDYFLANGKRTTNLMFQGFTYITDRGAAQYIDQDLSGLKIREAQFGAVGDVIGSVTGRAAP